MKVNMDMTLWRTLSYEGIEAIYQTPVRMLSYQTFYKPIVKLLQIS